MQKMLDMFEDNDDVQNVCTTGKSNKAKNSTPRGAIFIY